MLLKLDEIKRVQVPELTLPKARELLRPYRKSEVIQISEDESVELLPE